MHLLFAIPLVPWWRGNSRRAVLKSNFEHIAAPVVTVVERDFNLSRDPGLGDDGVNDPRKKFAICPLCFNQISALNVDIGRILRPGGQHLKMVIVDMKFYCNLSCTHNYRNDIKLRRSD